MNNHICVWSDGTWCYPNELSGYTHMSDDFARIKQSDVLADEDLADAHTRNALSSDWYIR